QNDQQRRDTEQFLLAFDTNLAPAVGQQVTLTSGYAGVAGPRITVLAGRDAAADCELIAKGTIGGEARGWVSLGDGTFQSDRLTEAPLGDAALRALAGSAGQELTYTCVPPGAGTRAGIDRDEDGYYDRDELDAGTDPADPESAPVPTLIGTKSLSLRDDVEPPLDAAKRRFAFTAATRGAAPNKRVVVPAVGS